MTSNTQLVTFIAVSTVPAGTSMSNTRLDTDRAVEVSNGALVGRTTINVGMLPAAGANGYYEYIVFKAQRQFTTPVKGTNPLPSDTEVIAAGLQQEYRKNMPGWIIQYGQFPITAETTATKTIKIDWNKFKMAKVRDGDFYGITYFNRTGATCTFDWQARYHSRQ